MIRFETRITGAGPRSDAQAARYKVNEENERRLAADPDAELLPLSPSNALLRSYQTAIDVGNAAAHESYKTKGAEEVAGKADVAKRWRLSSDSQRAAALAELEPLP